MKRITINKILIWIYALLMCLPLISVGFRSLYVTFNENAYESYSGVNQLQLKHADSIFDINSNQYGNVIRFDNVNSDQTMTGTYVYYNYLEYLGGNIPQNIVDTLENTSEIYVYFSGTRLVRVQDTTNTFYVNLSQYNFQFRVNELTTNYENVSQYLYYYVETEYFTLDNAFDYSIHEFIDNNNTGLINFVGLFSDMFLGNSNLENSLYLGFANFMMNYALFITCAYFVFEVLMWFINYVRRYMYSLENKGD